MAKSSAKGLATVLSFEKKIVLSDGLMYGTTWDDRQGKATSLPLREKSVRGTISNRLKAAVANDPAKLNAEVEKPNLQTVDAASLSMNQDTLKVTFTMKILPGAAIPAACNVAKHKAKILEMGHRYAEQYGFCELAKRYALNLANARFLWRNRVGAEDLEVQVKAADKQWLFHSYDYSLQDFDNSDATVETLAEQIESALAGKIPYLLLEITAFAKIGKGQEVYPSEELILDKGKGKKSKVLYEVNSTAAMHSQKLGNAIRTIDTWYNAYETEDGVGPISVEPYGTVTNLGKAFRNPKDKCDFYTLFDKYSLGADFDSPEAAHYVMAMLIRGGVFGASGKE
ncbi:type I-F CRISPR-associated protein Csy3 [Mitsuokella sp. AF21-1AC]|uniref:type I-F CRISPR-associated protein Csy3 n=1 Tax=Mitsuokella sp. AF21-1AC TaxID=2292235 RepID=UPI000E516E36|nr:type I-F CRISPR-associated protein Csy3 [Mitsuokella sp. AF21-1AC]RGS69722.1 type I-F CRISPR-associated protein Csy3 [Mitsuokella sp. AF21-1AC]